MQFSNSFSSRFLKSIPLVFVLLLVNGKSWAQAKFGDNRTAIQAGSLVELESTNKGLLNVRLNTTQMLSIPVTTASNGMMIYNTDSACICVYNGANWRSLCGGSKTKIKKIVYAAKAGDLIFNSPDIVNDENNVQVFRNGVQVNFNATIGTNVLTLELEAICKKDDEIKIIQSTNY